MPQPVRDGTQFRTGPEILASGVGQGIVAGTLMCAPVLVVAWVGQAGYLDALSLRVADSPGMGLRTPVEVVCVHGTVGLGLGTLTALSTWLRNVGLRNFALHVFVLAIAFANWITLVFSIAGGAFEVSLMVSVEALGEVFEGDPAARVYHIRQVGTFCAPAIGLAVAYPLEHRSAIRCLVGGTVTSVMVIPLQIWVGRGLAPIVWAAPLSSLFDGVVLPLVAHPGDRGRIPSK